MTFSPFDSSRRASLAAFILACGVLARAEEPSAVSSAPWLGRIVVLAVKDGAVFLDQEAWPTWDEAQQKKDESDEAWRKRVGERFGILPELVSDYLLRGLHDNAKPPIDRFFDKLLRAGCGRGEPMTHTYGTSQEWSADRPGFSGSMRFDKKEHSVFLEVVEDAGSKRRLSVEASSVTGLRLNFQAEGTSILLVCWPDGTTAVAATRGAETCRRSGKSFEEMARSAPEEIDRCLARPLAEIGIALPAVEGLVPPKDVVLRGLGVTPEEVERAAVAAAKRVDTSIATLQGHSGALHAVAFSPDGRTLLMGGADEAVSLWNAETWMETKRFDRAGKAAAWSADGRTIAAWGGAQRLSLIEVASGQATVHADCRPSAAAFGPGGKTLFVSTGDARKRRVVAVEVASWRTVRTFEGTEASGEMTDFALAPDGKTLAAAFGRWLDGEIRLWEVDSGDLLRTLGGLKQGTIRVAFGKDGVDFFSGGNDGDIRRWDAAKGEVKLVLEYSEEDLHCLAASPAGDLVARGDDDGYAKVRDAATGREVAALRGHRGPVTSVAWSPDGRLLATGSEDGTVKVWRVSK